MPSDDAAGLAISSSLDLDRKVFLQGVRNVNDGISALKIAESALTQISGILTRQMELATQAATGSLSTKQRTALNEEANALAEEVTRIMQTTEYNGRSLLNGSYTNVGIQNGYNTLSLNISTPIYGFTGDGTFGTPTTSPSTVASYFSLADLNNDGIDDLVSSNVNYIYVALGTSSGTFGATSSIFTGDIPTGVALGDVNNDGNIDIVASSGPGTTYYSLLGVGDGTFLPQITGSIGTANSTESYLYDLNNDGKLDLISIGNDSAPAIRVALGTGTGSFTFTQSLAASAAGNRGVGIGDLNGDGYADIFDGTSVYIANSNGTFNAGIVYGTDVAGRIADVNGDGYNDLIGASNIYLNNGSGSFTFLTTYGDPFYNQLKVSDINGDGELDILATRSASNSLVYVHFGNSNGTFSAATTYTTVSGSRDVDLSDLNGDGADDMVVIGSGTVVTLLGNVSLGGESTRMPELNLLTQSDARTSMSTLTSHKNKLSTVMGQVGAQLSRLEIEARFSDAQALMHSEAISRITDVDIASEAASIVRNNIQINMGLKLLDSINTQSEIALKLIYGN